MLHRVIKLFIKLNITQILVYLPPESLHHEKRIVHNLGGHSLFTRSFTEQLLTKLLRSSVYIDIKVLVVSWPVHTNKHGRNKGYAKTQKLVPW